MHFPWHVEQFEESYDLAFEKYPNQTKELLAKTEQLKNELRKLN
jgi:hypothetical protein